MPEFETGDDHIACPDELGKKLNKIIYTRGPQNTVNQTASLVHKIHVVCGRDK